MTNEPAAARLLIPRATYTEPEVASVGWSASDLESEGQFLWFGSTPKRVRVTTRIILQFLVGTPNPNFYLTLLQVGGRSKVSNMIS